MKKNRHYRHARRRARLRYDIDLTRAEKKRLVDLFRMQGVILEHQSNTRMMIAIWDPTRCIWIACIYSRSSKEFVSLLPPAALLPFRQKLEETGLGNLQPIEPYPLGEPTWTNPPY
jgi:hypothetical protein